MSTPLAPTAPHGLRLWLTASRPRTLSLSLVPVLLGSALAWSEGAPRAWPVAVAALLAAMLIQVGTNLYNDLADTVRGNDRPGRLGPPRVTAEGWASPCTVRIAALRAFRGAFVAGLYLAWVGGLPVVIIGLASLAAGWGYSGGPRPIAYTPLGEVFVLAFFGPVAVTGSHYLQSGQLALSALVTGAAVGSLAAAVLTVNNTRDIEEDRAAGRRTLSVVLGRSGASLVYGTLVLLPYPLLALLPGRVWPALLALPVCAVLALRFARQAPGRAFNKLLARTAQAQLVFGLLLCAGLLA